MADVRPFDFLCIGANRCGTTSLWRALDSHPQVRVPSDKEREFFSIDGRYEEGLGAYLRWTFPDLRDDEMIGTVTPQLMDPRALRMNIERIRATCPKVRLIALLRDPIERAISQLRRMNKVTGLEEGFDEYITRVVEKRGSIELVPLVRASNYGAILRFYFEAFEREQIRVFFTADLDRDPTSLYRQIFEFIGVDPDHDPGTPRVHVAGLRQKVPQEAISELLREMDRRGFFPDDGENARRGFAWWMRHIWNTEPSQEGSDISLDLRRRLAEHYLADAEVLESLIGVEPPWLDSLRAPL